VETVLATLQSVALLARLQVVMLKAGSAQVSESDSLATRSGRRCCCRAVIQANGTIVANQLHMTTTNCTWFGNTINCTSMR
jgi:hypothetical protein